MPRRKKSRFLIEVEYAAVKLFIAVVSMVPYRRAFALARGVGMLVYAIDRKHRERAMENLAQAFPEKDEAARREIVKSVYMNLVESVVETLATLRLINQDNYREFVTVEGKETLDEIAGRGRGIIFVTGHIGSWESLGCLSALGGYPLWSLARPLDNPLLNELVVGMRERLGQHILDRRGAMIHALRLLREGRYLAFLVDQNARRSGIFVPFFGRPASTFTSVARIALKTGCPIFFSYAIRDKAEMRFLVKIVGPLWPDREADEETEVYRITRTFTEWVEAAVRQYPDRWLWLHRRWRTQPE